MNNQYPINQTTGQQDQTIPWANGNLANNTKGSIVQYQHFVNVDTEVVAVIRAAGLSPTDADLTQLNQAIDHKISTAITAIPAPVIPAIPTYTGTSGVAIAGTVASLDINSLPATPSCTTTDFMPILRNGVDEKISVQNLATEVLSQYTLVLPPSVPLPTPASTLSYTYPSDIAIGNNTTGTFPLGNLNGTFGTGDSNKFTFTQAGLYSVIAFLQIAVSTNTSADGTPVSQARIYGGFTSYRNGSPFISLTQNGTAFNYLGLLSASIPYVSYFSAGETVSFTASGTGDYQNASAVALHNSSFINITKLG